MRKSRLVMAFGAFDLIHPGHLAYLKRAKGLGDKLMVVVARDSSVRLLKRRAPALGERARLEMVRSLRMVDRAVLGNKLTKPKDRYKILKRYSPAIIAFGYDQKVNIGSVKKWLKVNRIIARVVHIKTSKNAGMFKSSKLRKRA